jgi:hypothetical protein
MQFGIKQFIKFYTNKSTEVAISFLSLSEYDLKKKLVQKTITKYITAFLIPPPILTALKNFFFLYKHISLIYLFYLKF